MSKHWILIENNKWQIQPYKKLNVEVGFPSGNSDIVGGFWPFGVVDSVPGQIAFRLLIENSLQWKQKYWE